MPDVTPANSTRAFTEIGNAGLKQSSGRVMEEWLPQLKGRQGALIYREMIDNDPIIGGIVYGVEEILRGVPWVTKPYDDTPDHQRAAEFVDECRDDMSHGWADFIADALSKIGFGWSFHEVVYKRRQGVNGENRSRYNDNLIGWRKFGFRSQDTLERWEIDEAGGIRGLWQSASTTSARSDRSASGPVFLPIEKALLFRTTTRKNNPEGRSIFRNAYTPWWAKKRVEWFELMGIERDLAGIPSFGLPPEYFADDAPSDMKAALADWRKAGTQLRRDEQSALIWPKFMDDKGNDQVDIGLLQSSGARAHDTGAVIERYARYMAISTLQDIILLGHEHVGSLALADVKRQLATAALKAQLLEIAAVINRHEISRLFRLNGLPTEELPQVEPGEIENRDIEQLALIIDKTAGAGMAWFPNAEVEREVLALSGFDPTKVEAAAQAEVADVFEVTPPRTQPIGTGAEPDDGNDPAT